MDINDRIRRRLDELLMDYNLTLNGLAYKSGVSQSTLFNFTSGTNMSATITTLHLICEYGFGITMYEFFDSDLFSEKTTLTRVVNVNTLSRPFISLSAAFS